jgi:hypothetical protein
MQCSGTNTYNQSYTLYSIRLKVSLWSCSLCRKTSNHILWNRAVRMIALILSIICIPHGYVNDLILFDSFWLNWWYVFADIRMLGNHVQHTFVHILWIWCRKANTHFRKTNSRHFSNWSKSTVLSLHFCSGHEIFLNHLHTKVTVNVLSQSVISLNPLSHKSWIFHYLWLRLRLRPRVKVPRKRTHIVATTSDWNQAVIPLLSKRTAKCHRFRL